MAAVVALATVAGALGGALATAGIGKLMAGSSAQAAVQNSAKDDALASALVKTAAYRYPRPDTVQEMLFYTHPSVERRVRAAMDWKAAHPAAPARAP